MKIVAYCEQCARKHTYDLNPAVPDCSLNEWYLKHVGHAGVGFQYPERSPKSSWVSRMLAPWRFVKKWFGRKFGIGVVALLPGAPYGLPALDGEPIRSAAVHSALAAFLHNADTKTTYASSADYTITLASLATSSTLVVGRQSTVVSNTTNLYLDYLIGGFVTTGTTPTTATIIEALLFGSINDTPQYPDALGGSDAAWTATSADIKRAGCRLIASIPTDNTSNRTYPVGDTSLASCYGNLVPKNHGVAVTHSTAVNLNSTGSNQKFSQTGVYLTTA